MYWLRGNGAGLFTNTENEREEILRMEVLEVPSLKLLLFGCSRDRGGMGMGVRMRVV